MLEIVIPGKGMLRLEHLVCDVNGTLAIDGSLIEGVSNVFARLQDRLQLHTLTANTHGRQAEIDRQLGLQAFLLTPGQETEQKAAFVRQLGAAHTAAIGQGANDAQMLREAALGICVLSHEGTATATLLASDLVVPDILTALELFEKPGRLVASLRI